MHLTWDLGLQGCRADVPLPWAPACAPCAPRSATADQVLSSPWLGRTAAECTAPSTPLPGVVSERLRKFAKLNSLQKASR